VNYAGFTLVAIQEVKKTREPIWDLYEPDCLASLQERFWSQLDRIAPIS
jgi:hypothetical protein